MWMELTATLGTFNFQYKDAILPAQEFQLCRIDSLQLSGGHFNKKISYQCGDPHVKDKTVSRPSYL